MFTEFKKILSSKQGFSLPEIMVGSSILIGVGLAGAMLFKDQTKAQSRVEHDQILSQFHSQLAKTMENAPNCNATMNQLGKYNQGSVGTSDAITTLSICDTTSLGCSLESDASTAAPLSYMSSGDWIDKGARSRQIWSIQSMGFANTRSNSGPVRLIIQYQLNPRIANRVVSKEIILNLRFSAGGQFKECFNNQESTVNNLQNDLCKTLTPVASTGVVASWDEASQSCRLNGTVAAPLKDCTAAGLSVEGIRADGSVHCKAIMEGFNAAPSVDPAVTCPPPQKPSLNWSGNRMRVICI